MMTSTKLMLIAHTRIHICYVLE